MAYTLSQLHSAYKYAFDEAIDPRSKELPLIGRPFVVFSIIGLYVLFVQLGPKWMEKRQPFEIKKLIMIHNVTQVFACGYIFYKGLVLAWGWKYKWICEPVDYTRSKENYELVRVCYYYFLTKLLDLFDTVFFILRKKTSHVSFLHVYHHSLMVFMIWLATAYVPGGHGTLVGQINSMVHTIMYSYYFLTLAVPEIRKYLWMKMFVTRIQITQFVVIAIHMLTVFFKPNCEYPKWMALLAIPNIIYILILFVDFYIKNYLRKPKKSERIEIDQNDGVRNNHFESKISSLKSRSVKATIQ